MTMDDTLATEIPGIRAIRDHVLVRDMNFDERKLSSGIVLLGDDSKTSGIRPRWAQIHTVGPEQDLVTPGQWILVAHGRWTRGVCVKLHGEVMTLRRVDPEDILMVSDDPPSADDNLSTAVQAEAKTR